jgi:hypothetical protein
MGNDRDVPDLMLLVHQLADLLDGKADHFGEFLQRRGKEVAVAAVAG